MFEPFEQPNQNDSKVQMDRDALCSMMKSWLVPRSTGTLQQPAPTEEPDKNPSLKKTDIEASIRIRT